MIPNPEFDLWNPNLLMHKGQYQPLVATHRLVKPPVYGIFTDGHSCECPPVKVLLYRPGPLIHCA